MNNYRSGKWAEFLARLYLRLHGYRIVARNIIVGRGTTAGEIDIIACKHKCLVFVEVKKRRTLDEAAYAITLKQRQRLIKGAAVFVCRTLGPLNYKPVKRAIFCPMVCGK